jgi:hypothetical protein
MRYLLILAFAIGLYACENTDCENKVFSYEVIQSLSLRNENVFTSDSVDNISTTRKAYSNKINAYLYNFEVHTDIDLYDINNAPDKLQNISLPFDKEANLESGYQINSLYAVINLGDNISLYHGSIPFKGGKFSEIKDPTVNGGNGLSIINNQVYSSDFVSFHNKIDGGDFSLIAGKSEFNIKNHYNGLLAKNEGSSGTYILSTYEKGKHFFEVDYYRMTVKMNNLDYASLKIGGIGYIYDDSIDSGFTLYSNIGMSSISEDVEGLVEQYNIPKKYIPYYKSQGAVVQNTSGVKGYAGFVGINYEFDVDDLTCNIGLEEFITHGGWVSANHGVLFQSDNSWWANRNAIESTIYAGVNVTKNLRFSTKFVYTNSNAVPNAFSISQNAPASEAFHGDEFYTHFSKLEFLANYSF